MRPEATQLGAAFDYLTVAEAKLAAKPQLRAQDPKARRLR